MFWFLAGDIFLIKLENIKNIRYYIAFLLISTLAQDGRISKYQLLHSV